MSTSDQFDLARKLLDLEEVATTSGPMLTWGELAEALGVQPNAEGNLDTVELINACMGAQSNPTVQGLDKDQRLAVIRSASAAIEHLYINRGQ